MIRFFDFLFSSLAIISISPFLILLSIILKFSGEGKIFFLQERIGKNKKKFKVIKFATMLENSPNMGAGSITEFNDPRILPVGKILRKTKINELPQLFNVLKGNMSLIGPRPHVERDLKGVNKEVLDKVLSVKPGLSGIASIIFRNEESIIHDSPNGRVFYDENIAPFKAELESWYVKQNKTLLYFPLIFLTVIGIFNNRILNIYKIFPTLPPTPNNLKKYI